MYGVRRASASRTSSISCASQGCSSGLVRVHQPAAGDHGVDAVKRRGQLVAGVGVQRVDREPVPFERVHEQPGGIGRLVLDVQPP